jgi:adenine/guanine phosphoribosyltransferase-like PRPP-binding protein
MAVSSSYFGPVLHKKQRDKLVRDAIKDLTPHRHKFDSIAYRGNSGACMAPVLAWIFKKHLLVCRKTKEEESAHSHLTVEGNTLATQVLIVDDFIGAGTTIRRIKDALAEFGSAKVAGVYMYLREPSDYHKGIVKDIVNAPVWGRTTEGPGYFADPD